MDFYTTGINRLLSFFFKQLFLVSKNVLIVTVPILINKDVFELCYNDYKFMVRNCNYFCTNPIRVTD